jgi:hypothetical protein
MVVVSHPSSQVRFLNKVLDNLVEVVVQDFLMVVLHFKEEMVFQVVRHFLLLQVFLQAFLHHL